MILLILKLLLFAALTSVPFAYQFLVKKKRKEDEKYRNLLTAAQPHIPKVKKMISRFFSLLINFYDKMKRRQKPRKFFTLLLLLFLLAVQVLDNLSSSKVVDKYRVMAKEKRLGELSIDGKKTTAPFMQRKMANYLYPFLTKPVVYLFTFVVTVLLFSYKIANRLLTKIHNSKRFLLGVSCVVILFSFFDEGRYLLLSETLFIITLAALFYPNFYGDADPKGRKPVPQEAIIKRKAA